MKSKSKSVQTIISGLSSGYGAQRLPSALRAIEIHDVPSRGALQGQRAFLKDVLPKIKYHNDFLSIVTEMKKMPERKKRSGKEASTGETSSEASSSTERAAPFIRLHFSGQPTQTLLMEDKSATRITLEMTALIQKAVGGPIMTEEEINKVAAGETGEEEALSSEEDASDAALNPESISAMDSELPSASDTTATSPSIRQYPM